MRGTTPQTISSWVSIWRPASTRSSSSMRRAAVSRASKFPTPERGCASSWSAARPVESAEKVGYTSRSRPPGTCGRRSAPSWRSARFGITWSIRWRRSGCERPGRWAVTNEISRTRSRSRSCFARESSPSASSSPPTTCSYGGPGGNTIAFAASAHDSRPCWCISSTASSRNWSASGTRSRLRDASRC